MRKILGLLFISSSIFSMQLDLVKPNKTVSVLVPADKLTPAELNSLSKVYINRKAVFAPERLGSVELCHDKKGFSVLQDNKKHAIAKYFIDPLLRDITREQLGAFLQGGYLSINQMNNGEFSLKANGRIKGGGPALGAFMYWVTKSVCYGTAVAAVGTIAVGTGGTVVALTTSGAAVAGTGAVMGAAAATTTATVTGAAVGTTVGAAATATIASASAAAVTGGASTVATAIAVTGGASQAAVATAGVVSSAGGIAATIAGVEAVSVAVGTFFGMLPTP